jgi:hypothetical protein
MYEEYFENFSYVDVNSPDCIIRLNEPFCGVQVLIAKTFVLTTNNELKMDYEVVSVPEDIDQDSIKTLEFTDLIKHIFMAILEDQMNQFAPPEEGGQEKK